MIASRHRLCAVAAAMLLLAGKSAAQGTAADPAPPPAGAEKLGVVYGFYHSEFRGVCYVSNIIAMYETELQEGTSDLWMASNNYAMDVDKQGRPLFRELIQQQYGITLAENPATSRNGKVQIEEDVYWDAPSGNGVHGWMNAAPSDARRAEAEAVRQSTKIDICKRHGDDVREVRMPDRFFPRNMTQ